MSTPRPRLAELHDLEAHPEGGWYRQTWRSPVDVTLDEGRVRATATAILFALPAGASSAWHRVASDELWVAQQGRVRLQVGETETVLGLDVAAGERAHVVVPAGAWQRTLPGAEDALVTCLVSPGFDFADFELGAGPEG